MSHTCCLCGHRYETIDGSPVQRLKADKKIVAAAKVNGQGPFCDLCHHLEMASRYAEARGFKSMTAAVEAWQEAGARFIEDKP